jgi:hypothetical protein
VIRTEPVVEPAAGAGEPGFLAPWIEAWRGLRDNPFAIHFRQAEKRRYAGLPWWRRQALPLALGFVSILVALIVDIVYILDGSGRSWDSNDYFELFTINASLLIIPAYLAWLLEGLSTMVVMALGVLAQPAGRKLQLNLDDSSAITLLKDEEIIAGAVRVILTPILGRIFLGACLVWFGVFCASLTSLIDRGETVQMASCLLLAPLFLPVVTISGAISALLVVLYMLALGRGLMSGTLIGAAGLLTALISLLFIPASTAMSWTMSSGINFDNNAVEHLLPHALLVLFSAPLLISLLIAAARSNLTMRYISAIGTAPLAAVMLVVFMAMMSIFAPWFFNNEENMIGVISYSMSWSSLSILNPAMMPGLIAAITNDQLSPLGLGIMITMPLLVLNAQAMLLRILLQFARDSVHRRRCGQA